MVIRLSDHFTYRRGGAAGRRHDVHFRDRQAESLRISVIFAKTGRFFR